MEQSLNSLVSNIFQKILEAFFTTNLIIKLFEPKNYSKIHLCLYMFYRRYTRKKIKKY